MARGRRQKRRRISEISDDEEEEDTHVNDTDEDDRKVAAISSSDHDDENNNETMWEIDQIQKPPPKHSKNSVAAKHRKQMKKNNVASLETTAIENATEYDEEHLPFCCSSCTCPEEVIDRLERTNNGEDGGIMVEQFIAPDQESKLAHMCCCHGVLRKEGETRKSFQKRKEMWACSYLAAREEALDRLEQQSKTACEFEWVTKEEIMHSYKEAKRAESQFYNDDNEAHPIDILKTSDKYIPKVEAPFRKRVDRINSGKEHRKRAVVLDCFAGVGTAILVLKRLKIDLKKVISVEHDKVAMHVYRENHDIKYHNLDADDKLPDDGIEHVFEYETWESLVEDDDEEEQGIVSEQKIKVFLQKHGPIDIIIGGPPCIDYATVNAYRKGTKGKQGNYLLQFGKLCRMIERLQQENDHPVYFLGENVVTRGNDLDEINKAFEFDWNPVMLDSQYFSPIRRNRHFWSNLPLGDIDFESNLSHVGPTAGCLEDGFYPPAHIVDPETTVKCNCLMASKDRINETFSLRMYVFKEKNERKKYHGRPLKAIEREKLMGYPPGYIEQPVQKLFKELLCNGYSRVDREFNESGSKNREFGGYWKELLNKKYHNFQGNYHNLPSDEPARFGLLNDSPWVHLKLAPPTDKNEAEFFDANDYAKHLAGLAFSVPVVEHLLKPLQQIFRQKEYDQFKYSYTWEDTQRRQKP